MKIPKGIRETFVLQSMHHDCGIACLKSIYAYFGIPNSHQINEYLSQRGINLFDLKCDAEKHNLVVEAYKFEPLQQPRIDEISLLVVNKNNLEHAVIAYPYTKNRNGKLLLLIGDPAKGLAWTNYGELQSIGVLLTFKSFNTRKKQLKDKVSLIVHQFLSFKNHKGSLIHLFFLGLFISLLSIAIPIFIQRKVDQLTKVNESELLTFVLLMISIVLLKNFLSYVRQQLLASFAQFYHNQQFHHWLNYVNHIKYTVLQGFNDADFIKLLKEQHQRQQSNLLFFTTLFNEFTLLIIWISLAAYYAKSIALCFILVIGSSQIILWRKNKKLGLNNERLKEVNVIAEHEYLSFCKNIAYLSVVGYTAKFRALVAKKYQLLYQEIEENSFYQAKVQFLAENCNGLLIVSSTLIAVYYLSIAQFTKGEVLAVIMIAYYLYPSVNKLNAVITSYYEQIPNLGKLKITTDKPQKSHTVLNFEYLTITQKLSTDFSPSLQNAASYTIAKGDFLGITGINGAGKTTFIDGLLGLKPLRGYDAVWNDCYPIKNIKGVAYVPQEITLFNGSLIYNITLNENPDKSEFELFINQFQLNYFIAGFEFGAATSIRSNGEHISGGQKQMIGILRELYRKPAALFLDEPSNNLDDSYKAWLYHILNQINRHVAIICISHDAQILRMANQQIYLNKAWQTEELKVPL